jgi:peptidoglycan endopeptidase LytE
MTAKKVFQLIVVGAILVASFASTSGAMAWSGCASTITVQWGDTLSGLARLCGTTVKAIQAANPGLGSWVYAGQVLYIPTGSRPLLPPAILRSIRGAAGRYLGKIAARREPRADILAVNPQITNPSLIYWASDYHLGCPCLLHCTRHASQHR